MHWVIMMLLMYMSWGKLWEDWKIRMMLVMMKFYLKSILSERLLTMMSIFLSGYILTCKMPSTLMHIVIMPQLKCKSIKMQQMFTIITGKLQLPQLSARTWAGLAVATRQVPVDCKQPSWFQASTWDRNGHIFTQANCWFLP